MHLQICQGIRSWRCLIESLSFEQVQSRIHPIHTVLQDSPQKVIRLLCDPFQTRGCSYHYWNCTRLNTSFFGDVVL